MYTAYIEDPPTIDVTRLVHVSGGFACVLLYISEGIPRSINNIEFEIITVMEKQCNG